MKWSWDGVTSWTEDKKRMLGKRCHGNFPSSWKDRKIVDSSKMLASRLKRKMWRKTFRKIVFTLKYQIVLNFEFLHLVLICDSVLSASKSNWRRYFRKILLTAKNKQQTHNIHLESVYLGPSIPSNVHESSRQFYRLRCISHPATSDELLHIGLSLDVNSSFFLRRSSCSFYSALVSLIDFLSITSFSYLDLVLY